MFSPFSAMTVDASSRGKVKNQVQNKIIFILECRQKPVDSDIWCKQSHASTTTESRRSTCCVDSSIANRPAPPSNTRKQFEQ